MPVEENGKSVQRQHPTVLPCLGHQLTEIITSFGALHDRFDQ
jgi:hypothetical protein